MIECTVYHDTSCCIGVVKVMVVESMYSGAAKSDRDCERKGNIYKKL